MGRRKSSQNAIRREADALRAEEAAAVAAHQRALERPLCRTPFGLLVVALGCILLILLLQTLAPQP